MRVLPASIMQTVKMDYTSLQQAGSALGSGGVIVMDDTTCMVDTLACIARFYHHESCGQCTPCREGTGWIVRLVHKILAGNAKMSDLALLNEVAANVQGRTICAFGEAFAWPVESFLQHFQDEFVYFVKNGRSLVAQRSA